MQPTHRGFLGSFVFCALLGACAGSPAGPEVEAGTGGGNPAATAGESGATTGGAPVTYGGTAPALGGASGVSGASAASGGAPSLAGTGGAPGTGGALGSTGGAPQVAGSGGSNAGIGGNGVAGAAAGSGGKVDQASLPNVTLHLAGDSTVMTYAAGSAQEGWGQELGQFFISKVTIDNQAIGGASVQTFYTGRWRNIITNLKAGDYVTATFGANDSGTVEGRHVEPAAFQMMLGQMADEVKARQATFILVTPSALQQWVSGRETNTRLAPYVDAMKALAPLKASLLDDLNARSLEYLNSIGQTAAMEIYINGDKAHFTKKGATQMAQFVAEELRRIGSPLAAYLK